MRKIRRGCFRRLIAFFIGRMGQSTNGFLLHLVHIAFSLATRGRCFCLSPVTKTNSLRLSHPTLQDRAESPPPSPSSSHLMGKSSVAFRLMLFLSNVMATFEAWHIPSRAHGDRASSLGWIWIGILRALLGRGDGEGLSKSKRGLVVFGSASL